MNWHTFLRTWKEIKQNKTKTKIGIMNGKPQMNRHTHWKTHRIQAHRYHVAKMNKIIVCSNQPKCNFFFLNGSVSLLTPFFAVFWLEFYHFPLNSLSISISVYKVIVFGSSLFYDYHCSCVFRRFFFRPMHKRKWILSHTKIANIWSYT